MIITIKNYKRLKKHDLQEDDRIVFKISNDSIYHTVRSDYLETESPFIDNGIIFKELSVDKYSFCSEHYGYEVCDGDWPWFNYQDFSALTRVVYQLFKIIDDNNKQKL